MRIIDDAGLKQALIDGEPYDLSVIVSPADGSADVTIDSAHIAENGISINPSSVSGNMLELGSVISTTCDLTFYNYDGSLDGVQFKGAELHVQGSAVVGGVIKTFDIGYFIADDVTVVNAKITVKCFDRMIVLDRVASQQELNYIFPAPVYEIVSRVFSVVGMYFITPYTGLPNEDVYISETPSGQVTLRQIVSWAAQMMGRCVKINNKGQAEVVWYEDVADYGADQDHRFEGGNIAEAAVTTTGVRMLQSGVSVYTAGSDGYTLDIVDNQLLNSNIAQTVGACLENIWADIGAITYYPARFDLIHNVLIEPWDVIDYVDENNTVKKIAVTDVVYSLTARTAIESKGISVEEASYAQQSPFTVEQYGALGDAGRLKIGRIESQDEKVYFDLTSGNIFTDNETERVTSSSTKSVYETSLDFSNGSLALVIEKDGTEIGRTEIGVNGINIETDETQGFSYPKPTGWDNWNQFTKSIWWIGIYLINNVLNLTNTINNSVTITDKDTATYLKQANLSSQLFQVTKYEIAPATGYRSTISPDGLEAQYIYLLEGAQDLTISKSEYKYNKANVKGTIWAQNAMKIGGTYPEDPDAKNVATEDYADTAASDAISALGDYVESTGTDGIWTWEKWHSGKAVCWGVATVPVTAGSMLPWGSNYYLEAQQPYPDGFFVDNPSLFPSGNVDTGSFAFWIGKNNTQTATTAAFNIMRSTNINDNTNLHVNLYAIGKWK